MWNKLIILLFFIFSSLSCGSNIMEGAGNRTTDEAILDDIYVYQRDNKFDLAIAKFAELSAVKQAETSTQVYKAEVLADACGLDFLAMATSLANLSTQRMFPVLLDAMKGSTKAKVDYCIASEQILLTLHAASSLQPGNYLFMTFLSFAKIGAILATYTDKDGNGTVDAGIDSCATEPDDDPAVPTNNGFPTTYAKHIATGFSAMQLGLAGLGSTGGSETSDADSLLGAFCTLLDSTPQYDFCGVTDTTLITADQEKGVRGLVNENVDIGIGTCTGNFAACVCP